MDYYNRIEKLVGLATYDEDRSYEIDQGGIYWDPVAGKYSWITASGCSCWDGQYDESQYDTLSNLLKVEMGEDRRYSPGLLTLEAMAEEATLKAIEMGLIK